MKQTSIRWLVVLCRMLRSYGNVIILYADECYAIKPEVNYLMSKVECQVSLHTFSIPPSLFLTKNIFNVFPTMKFKLFQLICKNIVETFIFQYHRNNIHTFYCMVSKGRVWIFPASPLFYYKTDVPKWRFYSCKLWETRTLDVLNRRIYHWGN